MISYNMGSIQSKYYKKKFIDETIKNLNNIEIIDENNNIITENEIRMTLDEMYRKQTIHYYKNFRCKPYMLDLFVPKWWK